MTTDFPSPGNRRDRIARPDASPERDGRAPTRTGAEPRSRGDRRVAIIGAGFAGIAAGVELKRQGVRSFTIFDRQSGFGGTWLQNRFPGAEVDSASHLYSYSYGSFDWTSTHASQAELLSYLDRTARDFGLDAHFRPDTAIRRITWRADCAAYELETGAGEILRYEVVITAIGFLSTPLIPRWAEVEAPAVRIVHSAEWPRDLDLAGKRVGVVGTGSTAVQIVAEAAKVARAVKVFQREPNWVLPKNSRKLSDPERRKYRSRLRYLLYRLNLFYHDERSKLDRQFEIGTRANRIGQETAERHLRTALASRPDLIEKVMPRYPFWGKRPVFSDTYYPALLNPNVSVEPMVDRLTPQGVLDSAGTAHELDVVVLATGFRATEYIGQIGVTGRDGLDLHAFWNGDAAAYMGICVPGFPNFFIMYGPNTNIGPLVYKFEAQARFIWRAIRPILAGRKSTAEVTQDAYADYRSWLDRAFEKTSWVKANNYFTSKSGRVVTQWPFTAFYYRYLLKFKALRHIVHR